MHRSLGMTAIAIFLACTAVAGQPDSAAKDEAAIRAAIDSYVAAYNRGDAKAVAEHWSDTGRWVSPSGQAFQGREAIQRAMEGMFAESKGVKIEVVNPTVRLLSPNVAQEEGTVRVLRSGAPPSEAKYLATHSKNGGQWKLESVRETSGAQAGSPGGSPLADLEWLVGQWGDENAKATVHSTVSWTRNKTFLNYAFKISVPGVDDLEGNQIIGWDPASGTIRSWMFDSDGGFGEGIWSKRGNRWIVQFAQVLPDGRKASATNIYTLIDQNCFTWKSVGRKVDGKFLPNVEEVKIVRKSSTQPTKAAAAKPDKAEIPKQDK